MGARDQAGRMACAGVAEESAVLAGAAAGAGAGACVVEDQRLQQQQQSRDGKADSMSAQYSLLTTTNDSRLRIYDLDHFGMVRCQISKVKVLGPCGLDAARMNGNLGLHRHGGVVVA